MILIVEDNPDTAALYEEFLAGAGYDVERVGLGAEALQRLSAGSYGLVLLDLSLPDIGGVDVACRAREAGLAAPIIAVSGAYEHIDPAKLRLASFASRIGKPCRLSALLETVKHYLQPDR